MSQTHVEFDPKNWQQQRRERLQRMNVAPVRSAAPRLVSSSDPLSVRIAEIRRTIFYRIQTIVAAEYGIARRDLLSDSHQPKHSFPRQIAMYLIREMDTKALADIGRHFRGRDHTTVRHACQKVARMIDEDPAFAARVEGIKAAVRAS